MARLELCFLGPFQANLNSSPLKGFESDKVRADPKMIAALATTLE